MDCHVVFYVTMVTFWMSFLCISEQLLSLMMDEFIHWPKHDLLVSTTCVEMLPWIMENLDEIPLGK